MFFVSLSAAMTFACTANNPVDDVQSRRDQIPTPDRTQVIVLGKEAPPRLIVPEAIAAHEQGYAHVRASEWFAAVAAFDEAIRLQPDVPGLYDARSTAYLYPRKHNEAIADYSQAIELQPENPSYWRRRAHAYTISPPPQVGKAIGDATVVRFADVLDNSGMISHAVGQ